MQYVSYVTKTDHLQSSKISVSLEQNTFFKMQQKNREVTGFSVNIQGNIMKNMPWKAEFFTPILWLRGFYLKIDPPNLQKICLQVELNIPCWSITKIREVTDSIFTVRVISHDNQ